MDYRIHLTRGVSLLIIQSVGVNAIGLAAFVILTRLISTKEMGIWAILMLVNAACLTFATWFPQAVTKYVAENARTSMPTATAVFYQGLRANLVLYVPVVAGIYGGAKFLALHLIGDVSYAPLFRVLAFDSFFFGGIIPIAIAALLGLQLFRENALVGLIVGGLFRQILVISLLILMKNFYGVVIGWLVSDVATAFAYMVMTVRVLGRPRFDFPLTKLFRFYYPLELQQIVSFASTWFDRAILLVFVPLATLGVYNAAVTGFGVLLAISNSIVNVLFPALSSIQNKIGGIKFRDAIRLSTRYACFILIPIDFCLVGTARAALDLFLGQRYAAASLPLMIMCAADGITAFATVFGPAIFALEETKEFALIYSVNVGIAAAIAYLLIPELGIVGASVGHAWAVIAAQMVFLFVLRRKIDLQIDRPVIVKTLLAGTTMAVVLLAVQLVDYNKFLLPAYVLIGGAVYVLMLRLLKVVDVSDVNLLRRFLGKRLLPICNILGWMLLPQNQRNLHNSTSELLGSGEQ